MSEEKQRIHKFEMTEVESARADEFLKEHAGCRSGGAFGEKIIVSFIPTSMGDIVEMRCMGCRDMKDITDMEKF